jgi:ubiquinone biosynthesis protein
LLLVAIDRNRADDVAALLLALSLTTLDSDEAGFVHELRRKLPRYHWRPLARIRAGEALADLQRICLHYGIRLPPSFALVRKTLAPADSIARTLDPELDPIALLEDEAGDLMLAEAARKLAPDQLLSMFYTELGQLTRLPRRVGQIADRLETGTLKVGVVPAELGGLEHVLRSVANRIGAAIIVVGLLLSSALIARVHDLQWLGFAGVCLASVLGLYMVWKIIRTPGELWLAVRTSRDARAGFSGRAAQVGAAS